jgi:hypothetical protein
MVRLYILQTATPDLAAYGAHFYTNFKMTCLCTCLDTTTFNYICLNHTHCILFSYWSLYILLHVQPKHSTSHLKKTAVFRQSKASTKNVTGKRHFHQTSATLHLYVQLLYWSYQLYASHFRMWNSLTMTQLDPNMHETDWQLLTVPTSTTTTQGL